MNRINNDYENRIQKLNKKFDNLVSLVDKKPNFYNNIFFGVNSNQIPLNLINTNYINQINNKEIIQKNKNMINEDNSTNKSNYLLKDPLYLFSLPSSDDSENEDNNKKYENLFKSICEEIIDTDFLPVIHTNNNDDKNGEEKIKKILNNIYSILMFKSIPQLSSINDILKVLSNKIHIKPYEIKRTFLPQIKNYIFLIKFYSLDDAKKVKDFLSKEYKNKFHLCYDKRELKDSKWYCVIFRRDCNKDKNNYKFKDIIKDIFKKIQCDNKIISINDEGNIIKKGNYFYSAIRVDNLDDALYLCLKYNKFNNLKVHLHYLTYYNSKKIFPKILTQKEFIKEKKLSFNDDRQIYNKLFGSLKKNKKYKNEY